MMTGKNTRLIVRDEGHDAGRLDHELTSQNQCKKSYEK